MTNMFLAAAFEPKVFPGRVSELHSITLSLPKLIVDLIDENTNDDDDIEVSIDYEDDHCDDGYCDGGDDLDIVCFDNDDDGDDDSDDEEQYLCWHI